MAISKKRGRKGKPKVSAKELEKRQHRKEIRSVFRNAGFKKIERVSDVEFSFKERPGDFDDVYIYENIIVLAEYTTADAAYISDHLLKKKILFDHVLENKTEFIERFDELFTTFREARNDYYSIEEFEIRIVYCSKNFVSEEHKNQVPDIYYIDFSTLKYFYRITNAIKLSSRFELFDFFNLKLGQIGEGSAKASARPLAVEGTVLPEKNSYFDKGYKVVSFYIDPASLLKKAYVLRKDGWQEETGLYQRMIKPAKIREIRKYLTEKKRVFVNNIIITLPDTTKLLNDDGDTVNPTKLTDTSRVTIQIPDGFNTIGLIDGQHRVFAYHEGGENEDKISVLRNKQNLLTTGIIYPKDLNEIEKIKFESQLFLEINSNQTNADSELKQAITLLLKPFSPESIAKAVITRMNAVGPLANQFETHFFEKGKIKTTSIVSYALKPIVKLSGNDSLFALWANPSKEDLAEETRPDLLSEYVRFSVTEINTFLSAARSQIDPTKWTSDKTVKNRLLATTPINGLIICLRFLIENSETGDFEHYKNQFKGLDKFPFSSYKSSQYASMGRKLYEVFFS